MQPTLGAAVAAAAAAARACGLEAAAGAVEAAEPDGNGTRSCFSGSPRLIPLVADRRNFFKVELWDDDGLHICRPHRNL